MPLPIIVTLVPDLSSPSLKNLPICISSFTVSIYSTLVPKICVCVFLSPKDKEAPLCITGETARA